MSDITPADALRELGDDQAEYAAAAAKKLGLPESVEYVEMRTEYGVRYTNGIGKQFERPLAPSWTNDRAGADAEVTDLRALGVTSARVIVREVITTAWREVTP
ncbi:MAG TPA: hypothetical protein VF062_19485 [Candidatus Limnocylindrales bacterium]